MQSSVAAQYAGLDRPVVRYLNLRYLIESLAGGNVAAFAKKVGKSRANVAAYAGKNFQQNLSIGERFAQDIEQALELERGWMDTLHELPREVPPELLLLLESAQERLSKDMLKVRVDGTLPVLDSVIPAIAIAGDVDVAHYALGHMMATVACDRGFYLKLSDDAYAPHLLPGMLLQVDPDRRPTVEEVTSRPVFVVVTRPEIPHPVVRVVHQFGDLQLYGPCNGDTDNDPTPFVDPEDWEYRGMVVMRLIP